MKALSPAELLYRTARTKLLAERGEARFSPDYWPRSLFDWVRWPGARPPFT